MRNLRQCWRSAFIAVLIAILWAALTGFIVIYHLPQFANNFASNETRTTATTCSPMLYNGTICHTALQAYQGCLPDRGDSGLVFISPQNGEQGVLEDQAQQLFVGLELLNPSPMCLTAALPLLCLYYFSLCDSGGELYLPSSGECETLTTETCAREWMTAQSLLSSDRLPQCNLLPSTSTLCNGNASSIDTNTITGPAEDLNSNVTLSNNSRNELVCAPNFYVEELGGTRFCAPECATWKFYSDNLEKVMITLITVATAVGVVGGSVVLILSCISFKRAFKFPSGFVRYQTAAVMVYGVVMLIGRIDHAALYCSSRSLLTSFDNPSTFCTVTGVVFYYTFGQAMLWWLFHITAIFWGLQFPFHAEKFDNTGKNKCLYLTAVLVGLILPGILVGVHFITGGFDFSRIPAIYCNAMSRESNLYATIIPVAVILAAGVTMLILIFSIIYKERNIVGSLSKSQQRRPETKVLIILVYFFTIALVSMVAFTVNATQGRSAQRRKDLTDYLLCESSGMQPGRIECSRSNINDLIPAFILFDITFIILGSFPATNVIYALNVHEVKEKFRKCFGRQARYPNTLTSKTS